MNTLIDPLVDPPGHRAHIPVRMDDAGWDGDQHPILHPDENRLLVPRRRRIGPRVPEIKLELTGSNEGEAVGLLAGEVDAEATVHA